MKWTERANGMFSLTRITVLTLAALALLASAAHAQVPSSNPIIAKTHVLGLRRISLDKAMVYIQSKPNTEFSTARASDDISRLAASKLFRAIRTVRTEPTADGRLDVYFEVVEHPSVVKDVVYKHLKHVKASDLDSAVRVQRGMPLDKELNQIAAFELREHLHKEGYYFANVTLEEGYDERHERVVFNITEGPQVRVRSVDFVGQNELASAERLRTQIDTSRAILGFGGRFNPDMVNSDVHKLMEYYRHNGYLKVNVSRTLHFSDDYQYVDIVFHIMENGRFRVGDVSIQSTSKEFTKEQISSFLTVKKGENYDENIVLADKKNIATYVGWRGYPLDVRNTVTEIPDSPGTVRVQYLLQDRPQSYVGEVIIVGNTVTQDRVIRRMLGLYPGQVLQYPEIQAAEMQLKRLNIFEMNPDMGTQPTIQVLDNPGPFKDLLVKVKETRTGSLTLGGGVNSSSGLQASVMLNERNFDLFRFPTSFADFFDGRAFRGAGQELTIQAIPGTQIQRYTVSIREPYLFDQPYSLLTSGYYRDRIFNEYTEGRLGAQMSLSHMFTRQFSASVGGRVEDISVSTIAAGAPVDYTSVYGHNSLAAPNIAVTWDTRDSFMKPTEGGRVYAQIEQAFGSYTFPIFNSEASRYFTLWQRPDGSGKHVLAFHTQLSVQGNNAPVYERFFAGGFGSFRGFQFRGIGPSENGFMTGGHFQFLNSIEYQVPIKANDKLYAVAFVDHGTVEETVGISNYRVAVGFGIRVAIPMLGPMPLAFDFGFPIVKASTDQTQLFVFGASIYR